jgi:hypothetical protein
VIVHADPRRAGVCTALAADALVLVYGHFFHDAYYNTSADQMVARVAIKVCNPH